jgi:hypothetical protein
MRTCPRPRSFVPRSLESGVSGVGSWTGRIQASGYGYSARGANRANQRRGGRLGLCLAVSPSGPRPSFGGCLAPTPPRVKRERRHPMCITKNAAQQATTQPRSHSPTHGPKCPTSRRGEGGGGGGRHHPPTPTPVTLSDPSFSPGSPRAQIALPRMEIAVERSVFHLPPALPSASGADILAR